MKPEASDMNLWASAMMFPSFDTESLSIASEARSIDDEVLKPIATQLGEAFKKANPKPSAPPATE